METERRRFKRIATNSSLRYQIKGAQSFSNTVLKDYSEGGVGFLSNEYFPHFTKLIFEFNPPHLGTSVRTVGEIVWTKYQPYTERYQIGARFVEPLVET